MRFLSYTLLAAALAQAVVAPPPPPGANDPAPSFPTPQLLSISLTAWKATGEPVGTLPPLPKPVVQVPGGEEPASWAAPVPASATAAALAALAPAAAPAKARPLHRRALLQETEVEKPASPRAARAAAAIVAAVDGASPAQASLVEVTKGAAVQPASNVGGGDETGGAMEAAAEDRRRAAVAAAAADPSVPLAKQGGDGDVPPTGPIPPALTDRLKEQEAAAAAAEEPPPLGPGVSVFLEEKERAGSPVPGPAPPTVEPVGTSSSSSPPPHTSPTAPHGSAFPSSFRDSMTTAALPGARAFAATKPLPLSTAAAPSGLGPVFAASLPAALPAADDHGSGPAERTAAVGGTDVCAAPGGKLLILTADAVSVRDAATGALLAGPTPLAAFFQDATGGIYTSPRCVYDGAADRPGEKRTYIAALRSPADPASGGRPGATTPAEPAARLVVAATVDGGAGDPTGAWAGPFTVSVDGIDRRGTGGAGGGTKVPGASACPSLGCGARGLALGADAHGLWATTDLWTPPADAGADGQEPSVAPASLVGPLAVGLSKAGLKPGAPARPAAVVLSGFPLWAAHGGLAPSVTEPWSVHDTRAGGTAFLVGLGGGQVGVWGVHHTSALRAGLGAAAPTSTSTSTPPFVSATPFLVDHTRAAEEVPASLSAGIQRPSSLDLNGSGPATTTTTTTTTTTAPLDPSAPRRLARAALADGTLWFAAAAPVFAGGLSPTLGTAFFAVTPDVGSLGLNPSGTAVTSTGWVAVDGAATLAPTVAAGKDGVAVVAFALASPAFEPGFAYATLSSASSSSSSAGGPSAVKIVAAGQPAAASPAAALAKAGAASAEAVGAVQAFSFGGGGASPPPPTPPEITTHTPPVAAGSGHAGALDSIAVGLYSGATATPTGDGFWVGGRRAACGGGAGECVPAWATTVGLVTVAAEVV